METKIASTPDFIEIHRDSDKREYNRLLTDEFLDSLDPEGTHILTFHMPHEHAAGERVEPHMRTIWLMRVAGQDEAVDATLDMTLDNFNSLSTIRQNEDGEYEVVIGAHGAGRKA